MPNNQSGSKIDSPIHTINNSIKNTKNRKAHRIRKESVSYLGYEEILVYKDRERERLK